MDIWAALRTLYVDAPLWRMCLWAAGTMTLLAGLSWYLQALFAPQPMGATIGTGFSSYRSPFPAPQPPPVPVPAVSAPRVQAPPPVQAERPVERPRATAPVPNRGLESVPTAPRLGPRPLGPGDELLIPTAPAYGPQPLPAQ